MKARNINCRNIDIDRNAIFTVVNFCIVCLSWSTIQVKTQCAKGNTVLAVGEEK